MGIAALDPQNLNSSRENPTESEEKLLVKQAEGVKVIFAHLFRAKVFG